MKKVLYSLLIFVSIFFIVDKVSASFEEIAPVFTSSYTSTQLNGFVNNTSPSLSGGSATYNYIMNKFIANELYLEYGEYYICLGNGSAYRSFCFISDNIETFKFNLYNDTYLNLRIDTSVAPVYAYSINQGSKETSNSDWYTSSHYSGNFLGYQLNHNGMYIKTNLPYIKYKISSSQNTFKTADGYMFNSEDIMFYLDNNNNFVVNTDYKTSIGNEPYTFDEYIDDHVYSKMIFTFDLSILESRDHVFDLMLNNLSVENEINDGILYETERFEISYPYLEYETSTGLKDILYLKDYDDNEIKEKRKVFVGFYQERLPEDVISLKLIIPLYDTTEYQLLVQLVSWFPFEVSYETEEEMHSYYEYLDVSNKYGAMFIPKLVSNNSQITTYFLTRGIDTIYIYDTYDYKEAPKEIYEDVSDFTYSFSYDEQQYNLFFKTNTYSSSSTIYYDTRYFDYYIVDSKYSIGSITNPNTGENHYIDFSNTANVEVNFANIGDVFNFISDKIDSGGESYLLFKDSVSTFFNTMPTDIYILILTILAVILIGTALALGGWK